MCLSIRRLPAAGPRRPRGRNYICLGMMPRPSHIQCDLRFTASFSLKSNTAIYVVKSGARLCSVVHTNKGRPPSPVIDTLAPPTDVKSHSNQPSCNEGIANVMTKKQNHTHKTLTILIEKSFETGWDRVQMHLVCFLFEVACEICLKP